MKTTIPKLRKMIRRVITETSGEGYDQERVNRMIMFLDDIYGSLSRSVEFEYSEDRVFHNLQGEFPDASEEEIVAAMDSYGQSLY